MEHSVEAYLGRLSKTKAEQLWQEWVVKSEMPPYITPETLSILKRRLEELSEEQTSP